MEMGLGVLRRILRLDMLVHSVLTLHMTKVDYIRRDLG